MKQSDILVASAAVIALTLGVTARSDNFKEPLPLGRSERRTSGIKENSGYRSASN